MFKFATVVGMGVVLLAGAVWPESVPASANSTDSPIKSGPNGTSPLHRYTTQDPVGDAFVSIVNSSISASINQWPPELYLVILDFNQDGQSDLLVSANYFTNAKAGETWFVYKHSEDGFQSMGMPIDFNARSSLVRFDRFTKVTSIFNVHSGGANVGSLIEIRLSDEGIENRLVRQYNWENETDKVHWKSLYDNEVHVLTRMKRMNYGPLLKKYADKIKGDGYDNSKYFNSPRNDVTIDHRNPEYKDVFINSVEQLYVLVGGSLPAGEPTR